jgi:hypothetical protein
LLKNNLRKAREKKSVEGYLNMSNNGKATVLDYHIEYEDEKAYIIIDFKEEPQRILLSEEDLTYGKRTYLTCGCGNRVNTLYLNNDIFACRKCNKLRYSSTMLNRTTLHGQFIYKQSQILKLMTMRENMGRIFYRSRYSKRFTRWLDLCGKAGLTDEVQDAQKLLEDINSNR